MSLPVVVVSSIAGVVMGAGAVGIGAWAESGSHQEPAARAASGTLHACAAKKGGALRLASTCRKQERRVSLAKPAPRGPSGYQDSEPGLTHLTSTQTSVLAVRVPAGSYLATFTLGLGNDFDGVNGTCFLRVNGQEVSDTRSIHPTVAGDDAVPLASTKIITLSKKRLVDVACLAPGTNTYILTGALDLVSLGAVSGAWHES